MDKIEKEDIDIEKIFRQIFVELTKKMISIEMIPLPWIEETSKQEYCFLICTEGAFTSSIQFQIETGLYEKIAKTIYKKRQMTEEEKKLYVTEYLNIICGRILSEINNTMKKRSKLSVPMRIKEKNESEECEQRIQLSYHCSYGKIDISVYFDIKE
ncbi:MAG: chemotaxis protein CheX [Acetivibrio sp.]